MSAHAKTLTQAEYRYKAGTNRLGLWLFLLSDSFMFGGLLISRIALWGNTRPELNQYLGLVVTSVLLISSFFMNRAETAAAHGDRKNFFVSISITLVLGIAFLLGVVGVEWQIAPFSPSADVYGAIFYTMTGLHALHVLSGVIFLLFILNNYRKGIYTPERHWPVEAAAVYWHFVDVVWIFFYPALYLMGKLI
jgi:cytochrome c oxidase subunit 3